MLAMDGEIERDAESVMMGPPIPVNERYFTKYYTPKSHDYTGEDCDQPLDQCVLRHSNKICVVCIAPSHPIVADDSIEIEVVRFQNDVSANKVHGKRKRGGLELLAQSPVCEVSCRNGSKFILRSCVRGYLIEVNEKLEANPSLLKTKPLSEGYLAIVTQKLSAEMPKEMLKC